MNSKLFGIVASLFLLTATSVRAVPLVDQGDHTFDPNTGLRWLDLTLSTNRNYIGVSANFGAGGTFEGYRYATAAEVSTLFANAGLTDSYNGSPNSEAPLVQALMLLLGQTIPGEASVGLTASANPSFPGFRYSGVLALRPWADQQIVCSDCTLIPETAGLDTVGSFLVAGAAAPIPAALPLFATGLGALALLARRRRKQAT
jgi:hypothetical protein